MVNYFFHIHVHHGADSNEDSLLFAICLAINHRKLKHRCVIFNVDFNAD